MLHTRILDHYNKNSNLQLSKRLPPLAQPRTWISRRIRQMGWIDTPPHHFRLKLQIAQLMQKHNFKNDISKAPLGQFKHMIPTFHSELSALHKNKLFTNFFYHKGPFGAYTQDCPPPQFLVIFPVFFSNGKTLRQKF